MSSTTDRTQRCNVHTIIYVALLFPVAYRGPNSQHTNTSTLCTFAVPLPVSTVVTAVEAMCKYCSSVYTCMHQGSIEVRQPQILEDT